MQYLTPSKAFTHAITLIFSLIIASLLSACNDSSSSPKISSAPTDSTGSSIETQPDIAGITQQAYVFGLPLVEHFKLVREYLGPNTEIGANTFVHKTHLLTAADREIIGPNNDTLNSSIMFDLRAEPVVISIPEVPDRYFSIQLLNIFTNNLPLIAEEQKGASMQNVILAGPDWDINSFENTDNLPVIESNSSVVLGFLRIGVDGESDVPQALAYQSQVMVLPLSEYTGSVSPEPAEATEWPMEFDVKSSNSPDFFSYMNFMMQFHSFEEDEIEILEEIAILNVGSDKEFSINDFDADTQSAINQGINAARNAIQFPTGFGARKNGWSIPDNRIGNYGTDYAYRAVIAWYGTYAMPLSETAYFLNSKSTSGADYSGGNSYQIHFAPENLPSDSYLWSLTLYDGEQFLADNVLDRYSIGDRSDFLEYNNDGSLTIYMQHTSPGAELESNWLPTPEGKFTLSVRVYGPNKNIQSGNFELPVVELIQ